MAPCEFHTYYSTSRHLKQNERHSCILIEEKFRELQTFGISNLTTYTTQSSELALKLFRKYVGDRENDLDVGAKETRVTYTRKYTTQTGKDDRRES